MINAKNPFHDLYVTEIARPDEFVQLFSPLLVPHALLLFQPGHLVLKGSQGSGKSMLLTLLSSEIRLAYAKAHIPYPVPQKLTSFVAAGINLTRSGILDIGQRPIDRKTGRDARTFPLYFGDFFNYWVVRDVVEAVIRMSNDPEVFPFVKRERLEAFATLMARKDCWFSYLHGAVGVEGVLNAIKKRIVIYRNFHLDNIEEIPEDIIKSKTNVGEPISQTAEALRESGVVSHDVPLFIRIDQLEILSRADDIRQQVGAEYRKVINKALSTRDPRVFYRVGTRRYAWNDNLLVFGTDTSLEHLRDYRLIDLDEALRRKENTGQWVFPEFAEDIFIRRINYAQMASPGTGTLAKVMGRSPKSESVARRYVGKNKWSRALKIDEDWPKSLQNALERLFVKDPLSAKLAEAWLRQKSNLDKKHPKIFEEVPLPWDRQYWKKERTKQALFQLAARCAHRPEWSGSDSILGLCMGGTLVFVSLCQHIWDAFLMSQMGIDEDQQEDPIETGIAPRIQAVGIFSASYYWHDKIREQPGGNTRQRFVDLVGRRFYRMLKDDAAMSYPGHNGFSVADDELKFDLEAKNFLGDAVDYGDLQEASHTTKLGNGRTRTKWYLNPILSPYFRLPESHVKEPLYINTRTLRGWLREAHVELTDDVQDEVPKTSQLNLYEGD